MSGKILFFIDNLHLGGKERRFIELLYFLARRKDYEMQIVVVDDRIDYKYIYDLDIQIIILGRKLLRRDPSVFFRFYKIAQKFKPDIIHTWSYMTTVYAIPVKLLLRCPIIANLISDVEKGYGEWSFSNFFFKISCYYSDYILANSIAGTESYGIDRNKCKVIYNGINLERFKEKIDYQKVRKEIGINTEFIVIMVASFSRRKDYGFFIDVAKKVGFKNKKVTFIGVGDGSLLQAMQDRIKSEKVSNVLFTGRKNNIESIISISDIGVLFSEAEGISNSILEYMALAKPVITTDIKGGSREIIENNKSGFIIKKDIKLIADKIAELLNNKNMRCTIGIEARKQVEIKFSLENMGEHYLNIYNIFLGG